MEGVGTLTYLNAQYIDVAEWESQTPDERKNDLYESLDNDIFEDVGCGHDYRTILLNTMKFSDTQGNSFSVNELVQMTSSELILRGILKSDE